MRVCLICVELFAWGKYGGYGRATRIIGRELARRGLDVFAVVPQREGQKAVEHLDGMTVLSFPRYRPWHARPLFRQCNADVYHSQEPSMATYYAMDAMPGKRHLVTIRDPKTVSDWLTEVRNPSISFFRTFLARFYDLNFLVKRTVRKADGVYCVARPLALKAQAVYGLKGPPEFLPSPIRIPGRPMRKNSRPTVCYAARCDPRKRPEIFFEMAGRFPDVQFIAAGKSHDPGRDERLRNRYGHLPNLRMMGWIDQFSTEGLFDLLEESWILVNPGRREGLPTAHLEAMAHGCAILSSVDPGGLTRQFGEYVPDDDFSAGLSRLLQNGAWKRKAEEGYSYVKANYELEAVMDRHLRVYQEVINGSNGH